MMPIRPEIHALTEFSKPVNEMTLREAMEWYKVCVRQLAGTDLRPLEATELNQRWVHLVDAIAEREGVPTGSLSYYLAELAQAEIRLKETVAQEAADGP